MKLILVVIFFILSTSVFANRSQNRAEKRAQEKAKKKSQNRQQALAERVDSTEENECEIDEIVQTIHDFMLARSVNYDGDLRRMVRENLSEIIVFYRVNARLIGRVKAGAQFQNRRIASYIEAKLKKFQMKLNLKVVKTSLECLQSKYYKVDRLYKVDVDNETVVMLPPKTNKNLCETSVAKKELKIFEEELKKSKNVTKDNTVTHKVTRPRKLIEPDIRNPGPSTADNPKIADHHIIKQSLIEAFLKISPSKKSSEEKAKIAKVNHKNGRVLLLRLRNYHKMMFIGEYALQKLILYNDHNLSNYVDIDRLVDDDYLEEIKRRSDFWSNRGGNIFRGPLPSLRGPFDPNTWDDEYAFEEDAEPIIGQTHARYSRTVSENLKEFVAEHHNMDDEEKETKHNLILSQLNYAMNGFPLTRYNSDQWELVVPTEADLDRLKNQKSRKIFENKKYWKIKQEKPESKSESEPEPKTDTSKMTKRSIANSETEVEYEKMNAVIKQRWMEFVLISMEDQIEADSYNKSLEWSNDLKNLYYQYKLENRSNIFCPNITTDFDQFLYSKIFFNDRWLSCFIYNKSIDNGIGKELCSALKRVTLNAGPDKKNLWLDKSSRPQQFLKDRTTIWKGLNQITAIDQVPKFSVMVEEMVNDYKAVNIFFYNKVVNIGSVILPLIQYIPCNKNLLTRVKRDINIINEYYKREWFLDTDDSLKCL